MKTPVSSLRELLKIYEAWTRQGGSRASLAGDYDWDEDAVYVYCFMCAIAALLTRSQQII